MERRALPGLGAGAAAPESVVTLQSASAQVASILRREIQSGEHGPHERLRQRDVAARLGVSTTPVREAFQVLQAEGFLVVENHRGAVVVAPTVDDVREGYAIRTSLETLAIRHASGRFDADSVESLRALLARMRSTSARDEWTDMDGEFHRRLNEMAGMPRLVELIDHLRSGIAFYIESAFEDGPQRHAADHDHVELLEACIAGDADRAERVLVDHLDKTASVVLASLERTHRATG